MTVKQWLKSEAEKQKREAHLNSVKARQFTKALLEETQRQLKEAPDA